MTVALMVLGLSGCLGSGSGGEVAGPGSFVSEEAGAIRGVVVDDLLQPVADAMVRLDSRVDARTGPAGNFSFGLVAPGTHDLTELADGYEAVRGEVEVEVGKTSEITLTIVRAAIAEAYHETFAQAGQILCSTGTRGGSSNTSYLALCAVGSLVTDTSSIDKPFLDWEVGSLYGDVVGYWAETQWTSTQALGRGMLVVWFVQNQAFAAGGGSVTAGYQIAQVTDVEGMSPVRTRIPIEAVRGLENTRAESGEGVVCPPEESDATCWMLSGHYASAEALPTGDVNVGFTFQQRYEDFLTVFHGGNLPHEFTALPDA